MTIPPGATAGPLTDSATAVLTAQPAAIAGSFAVSGGGSFSVGGNSLSSFTVQGGSGTISSTQDTAAGCGAQIEYPYASRPPVRVPEPATRVLPGLAVVGAGVAGRRFA